jgi:hypothetical protein
VESTIETTLSEEGSVEMRRQLIAEIENHWAKLAGVQGNGVASRLMAQLLSVLKVSRVAGDVDHVIVACEVLANLGPKNIFEAMLGVQTVAIHEAAMRFLHAAMREGQTSDSTEANLLRATRLARLFNEQLHVMGRLRGRPSQQTVTVEHVHVHPGGQAIVGAVSGSNKE